MKDWEIQIHSSHRADILSGMLAQATGQSLFDFATEHLFLPLGITVEMNVVLHRVEKFFLESYIKRLTCLV